MENIQNKEGMASTIRVMIKELDEGDEEWTNRDLREYLLSMASWIEDMDGYYLNQGRPVPENMNWNVLRDILMAAKMYE